MRSDFSLYTGRPGSTDVPRNPLTRWDVSSIPANGIFLTKKLKTKKKNAQRVENDEIVSTAGRPGSSEVPRNPLTRWAMSSIPAKRGFSH